MDIAHAIAEQLPVTISILLIFAGGYAMASGRDAFRIITGSFVLVLGTSLSVTFIGANVSTIGPLAKLMALALILTGLGLSAFFTALSVKKLRLPTGRKDTRIGGSRT